MDEKLRQLLDQMPDRPPRSKLQPHLDVIRELRRKRRTYQEISVFLREHVQLSVAPSTIHDFVKTRARQARNRVLNAVELPPAVQLETPARQPVMSAGRSLSEDPRERIRAVKARPIATETSAPRFQFDPQEPLTLQPKPKEK
jgi:IS30 family transposase